MRYAYVFAGLVVLIFLGCLGYGFKRYLDEEDAGALDEFQERERRFEQDQHTEYME